MTWKILLNTLENGCPHGDKFPYEWICRECSHLIYNDLKGMIVQDFVTVDIEEKDK